MRNMLNMFKFCNFGVCLFVIYEISIKYHWYFITFKVQINCAKNQKCALRLVYKLTFKIIIPKNQFLKKFLMKVDDDIK